MNVALPSINGLSLCAGGGMLDVAVGIAEPRFRTVCYVEREASAAATLVARMADQALCDAPVWSDLLTFDARPWRGLVDIVISGDPCQPNSVAGLGKGKDDDRFLAEQVLRIFDESGATRLFRENVTGNAEGQLDAFVPALESLGCCVAAGIFAAKEVGASHQRERLFIMADRQSDNGRSQQPAGKPGRRRTGFTGSRYELADTSGAGSQGRAEGTDAGGRSIETGSTGPGSRELAHAPRFLGGERSGRQRVLETGEAVEFAASQRQRQGWSESARQQRRAEFINAGLPVFAPGPNDPRWPAIIEQFPEVKPAVCGVADGLARRVDRLRLGGNGVSTLQAAFAYRTLSAHFAATDGTVLRRAAE